MTIDGPVSVAPGATLDCSGPVVLASVALSDDGMGTIEGAGVSLAADGTFVMPKFASGVSKQTFHTSLKTFVGKTDLSKWSVSVDGEVKNYDVAYDAATGDVTVSKRGLLLLVR